jgi:putative hemolysin
MNETATVEETLGSAAETKRRHIVDILIEERTTTISRSPFWPILRAALDPLLHYSEAIKMADAIAEQPAHGVFEYMSEVLRLDLCVQGLEHVPAAGPVIVAPNHPTGIADGIAMYDALKAVRQDISFYANRDAIRVAPKLIEMVIPVEWVVAKRSREKTRETLAGTVAAFSAKRCVVLFPSGRLAFMNERRELTEHPWQGSVATFARKYDCPIVPVHISARNSALYYFFWKINTELRDMTVFNELLNKRGKRFEIRFGAPIPPDALPEDTAAAAEALRRHAAYELPKGEPWRLQPVSSPSDR